MASATSASSGKRDRASSLSTTHLLLSVGAMASGGREGFGSDGGKRVFGCPWRARSGQIYRVPAPAGNVGGRTGTTDGKHWPARPSKFLATTVTRARILRRAPCLRRWDVHADKVGNKCVGPLGCPPTQPDRPHFGVRGPTQIDKIGPFRTPKWGHLQRADASGPRAFKVVRSDGCVGCACSNGATYPDRHIRPDQCLAQIWAKFASACARPL
jgi:hypothetical protein